MLKILSFRAAIASGCLRWLFKILKVSFRRKQNKKDEKETEIN